MRSITTGNQRIKQTDSRFSRLSVARLSGESVSNVTKKTLTAIEYFQDILIQVRQQQTPEYLIYYMARLHNLIEFLSRLAVVSESDNAIDLFNFGLKLCISIGNGRSAPWESIDNLLRRSLEAVEPSRRADLVLDVLELPLLNEDAIYKSWQSRFEIFDLSRPKAERQTKRSSRWNSAIKKLIEAAGQNSDEVERQDAAYRLYGIKIAGVLTHQEDKDFCKAVWRHTDEDGLPSSLLFYPHVYLNITSHRPQSTTNVFDAAVVQKLANGTISVNLLEGIIKASTPLNNQHEPYPLSVKNALAILNKSLEWKPEILILMSISGESSRISN